MENNQNNKPSITEQNNTEVQNVLPVEQDDMVMVRQRMGYSSPFPHPDHLEHYNKINPDFADRILKFTEENGKHRRENENIVTKYLYKRDISQIFCAFGVVIIFVGASLFAGMNELKELSLGIIGFGGATTLPNIVSTFLNLKTKNSKNKNTDGK